MDIFVAFMLGMVCASSAQYVLTLILQHREYEIDEDLPLPLQVDQICNQARFHRARLRQMAHRMCVIHGYDPLADSYAADELKSLVTDGGVYESSLNRIDRDREERASEEDYATSYHFRGDE